MNYHNKIFCYEGEEIKNNDMEASPFQSLLFPSYTKHNIAMTQSSSCNQLMVAPRCPIMGIGALGLEYAFLGACGEQPDTNGILLSLEAPVDEEESTGGAETMT
nr:hypothetical protein Iba_chr04fCG4550 [Ipomoea batatas]